MVLEIQNADCRILQDICSECFEDKLNTFLSEPTPTRGTDEPAEFFDSQTPECGRIRQLSAASVIHNKVGLKKKGDHFQVAF